MPKFNLQKKLGISLIIKLFQMGKNIFFHSQQRVWLFICWAFIVFGCLPKEHRLASVPSIEIDITSNAKLKLSEYFENFRMLKLPTDTLMGEIKNVKYENNKIYISDGLTLFVFSEEGNLVSCFEKRGEAPDEYSEISDFMINGENITILDRNQQKIITYNHSGNNISMFHLEYYAQAISPIVNHTFFLYNGFDPSHKLHRIKNWKEDSTFLEVDKNQSEYLFIFAHHNFYQDHDSIYFFQPVNDTIYKSVNGGSMEPFFYVDFKGKNIPASFFNEKKYENIKDFFDNLHKRSYAYGIYSFIRNERFMMFGSFYQKNKKLTLFDYKSKSSNTFDTIQDDVYFNGLTIPVSQFIYHANKSGSIVVPLEAYSVVEWRNSHAPSEPFESIINVTHEDDNPLLLIFDFKQ